MGKFIPKKIFFLDVALILVLIALITFAIMYISTLRADKHKNVTDAATLTYQAVPTKIEGISTIKAVTDQQSIQIEYPKTANTPFDLLVSDTVQKSHDQFVKQLQQNSSEKTKQYLYITYKTYVHDKIYSFVLTEKRKVSSKKVQISVKTFIYHTGTKQVLSIQDVVKNKQSLEIISSVLSKKVQQDRQLKESYTKEQWEEAIEPLWSDLAHFSLDGDDLHFYFNIDATSTQITIPLHTINSIVQKEFYVENPHAHISTKGKKLIALTFDDGPNKNTTPKILKVLKKHKAKATFFMVGEEVVANPQIAKNVLDAGHEIGNHSYTHANLQKSDFKTVKKEISLTEKSILKATGQKPTVFRPPYGAYNKAIENYVPQLILWDIDTLDWKYRNADYLLSIIQKHAQPNRIVLMHDIHESTANGLDAILTYLDN